MGSYARNILTNMHSIIARVRTVDFIVPNQFFIKNSKQQASFNAYKFNTKRIVSTIFMIGTSWKNQLFLDITGRNDWSSALVYSYGTGNFSYFYPF